MAEFIPALEFLLNNEDRRRAYASVPDPTRGDPQARAISGINSAHWPVQYQRIASLPHAERADAVAEFYRTAFWNPMGLDGLESQDLASRVLDEGVNAGSVTAVELLQDAINALGGQTVQVDGHTGPKTLAAANSAPADALLDAYRHQRMARYLRIVASNPGLKANLPAWEARAMA